MTGIEWLRDHLLHYYPSCVRARKRRRRARPSTVQVEVSRQPELF